MASHSRNTREGTLCSRSARAGQLASVMVLLLDKLMVDERMKGGGVEKWG